MLYDCPFCHHRDASVFRNKERMLTGEIRSIYSCNECRCLYPSPRKDEKESNDYISNLLTNKQDYTLRDYRNAVNKDNYVVMKLKEWINCEGAALDVGSFIGGFCSNLNKLGFDAYGLESQDRAVAFARDNGLNVFHGSFSRSIPTELLNVKFSFVSLMESIYYIVDLKETFLRIYEILKQDGYLLIQTINARSEFYEKNSLFVRYGDYVQEYPSLDSLQFWLHKSGFSIVRLTALPVYHINKLFQININVLGDMTQRLGALLHMCHNIYKCDIERADKLVLLAKRN